uniref:Membrane-bound transcription factor site-2 protease n=1 Tax=Romanomermis culicivorax TaxID=13658 RepID=A0A915HNR7_ROMCU
MLITTIAGLFFGVWSLILLLDYYFKSRNSYSYNKLIEKLGLIISPFHLRFYLLGDYFEKRLENSQRLKSPLIRKLLDYWFLIGVFVSVGCSIFILHLLCLTLTSQLKFLAYYLGLNFTKKFSDQDRHLSKRETTNFSNVDVKESSFLDEESDYLPKYSSIGIVPVVPGLNLPWSHAPLLFLVLILAGLLHELGHALVATNERVKINGFGLFLLGVYPGAFTELHHEDLYSTSAMKRLKIFCAGIWHNIATVILCMICISGLPYALNFGYSLNKGVLVTDVRAASGLRDVGGLKPGDVVYEINYCKVENEHSWRECLKKMSKQNTGYCVPKLKMRLAAKMTQKFQMDEHGELKCCQQNATASHMCFYYKMYSTNSNNVNSTTHNDTFAYSCLPARYVTDHFFCNYSKPCQPPFQTSCIYPALFNNSKLFRFQLDNINNRRDRRHPVLFIGQTKSILDHVTVKSHVPRKFFENIAWPIWLPDFCDLFLRYLFTFSLAFALLNAMPCYTLDGQYIFSVLTTVDTVVAAKNRPLCP